MNTKHMTAPRWITEAIEAEREMRRDEGAPDQDAIATALIERLPIEAVVTALASFEGGGWMRTEATKMVATMARVLTEGDPEVVELTELYQDACRALDEAGVPYAIDVEIPSHIVIEATIGKMAPRKEAEIHQVPAHPGTVQLGLADRIRWLAQQRPTRLDLSRIEAERDAALDDIAEFTADELVHRAQIEELKAEREALRNKVDEIYESERRLTAERDQLQRMYEGASDDLDRERTNHQDDMASRDAEIVKLAAERDDRSAALRALVDSDLPAGGLRRALAVLVGPGFAAHTQRVERANFSMTEKLRAAEEARDEARARLRQLQSAFPHLEQDIVDIQTIKDRAADADNAARALESEMLRLSQCRLSAKNMRKELRSLLGVKP